MIHPLRTFRFKSVLYLLTYLLLVSAVIWLDLWLLTLKLVRIIAREVYNLPTNFGVPRTFRYRLIGQHLSDVSRDHTTLTYDLGGHGACCWCGSSCSVCIPSFNFVGLPVRKIWRTSGLSISRPGDLAFNLETMLYYPWRGQPSHQFWCF